MVPAKYVSLHAEMVHRLFYIIYIFIAHSWGLFHRVTRPGSNTQRLTALSWASLPQTLTVSPWCRVCVYVCIWHRLEGKYIYTLADPECLEREEGGRVGWNGGWGALSQCDILNGKCTDSHSFGTFIWCGRGACREGKFKVPPSYSDTTSRSNYNCLLVSIWLIWLS